MHIRDARRTDDDAIADLHAASWRSAYPGILTERFLEHDAVGDRRRYWRARLAAPSPGRQLIQLAVEHERLLGFMCVLLDQDERWGALLDHLHIHPDEKGRGLGRRLMAQAASWVSAARPGGSLHLWVYEANQAARGFYERFGGVVVDRRLRHAADGHEVAAVCYAWPDAAELVTRLAAVNAAGR